MAQNIYDIAIRSNLELRAKRMSIEVWLDNPWLRFTDFVSRTPATKGAVEVLPIGQLQDGKNIAPASRAVIKVFEDFSGAMGGTSMMLPVKRILRGNPTFGDDVLLGKAEVQPWVYRQLRIARVRKAVNVKAGEFNEQTYKYWIPQIADEAEPQLTDWFRRYLNATIKHAFYNGRSIELSTSRVGGRALTEFSHPNFYTPASGYVSQTGFGTVTYETAVETAINSMTNAHVFNYTLVRKMRSLVARKKLIAPIKTSIGDFFPWIITSAQAYQLRGDSEWQNISKQILPFSQKDEKLNWLLNGCMGMAEGFMFFEDVQGYGVHTNSNPQGYGTAPTSGYPEYGVEWSATDTEFTPATEFDSSVYQMSLILGTEAMYGGLASRLKFGTEIYDYENQKDVGASMIMGFERSDEWDTDGQIGTAGAFVQNSGSIAVCTYSEMPS